MVDNYKRCPNGHYYDGNLKECPYCKMKHVNDENDCFGKDYDRESTDVSGNCEQDVMSWELKVCNNLHAYDAQLDECPICDSSLVVDGIESKGNDTWILSFIFFVNPVRVKLGEEELKEWDCIVIEHLRDYKHSYHFSDYNYFWNRSKIEPDMEIQVEETMLKGKEIIRVCDIIVDIHNRCFSKRRHDCSVDVGDFIQLNDLIKRVTQEKQ